jgi:hypothetical protein
MGKSPAVQVVFGSAAARKRRRRSAGTCGGAHLRRRDPESAGIRGQPRRRRELGVRRRFCARRRRGAGGALGAAQQGTARRPSLPLYRGTGLETQARTPGDTRRRRRQKRPRPLAARSPLGPDGLRRACGWAGADLGRAFGLGQVR